MWTTGSNLNESGFTNSEYDLLISQAMGVQERKDRYEKMADAERILLSQGVVLPLRNNPAFNLVNRNMIEGWFPNPLDIHPFQYIRFKKNKIYPGIVMWEEYGKTYFLN